MRQQERLDHILMDHAAGNLGTAASFVLDAHLALNPQARGIVEHYEALGGYMLDQLEPAELGESMSAETVVAASASPFGHSGQARRAASGRSLVTSVSDGKWRRGLSGFMTKPVAGVDARLLRLQEGRIAPFHGHRGLELTLVLCGTLEDEFGRYQRGDLVVHDEETEHQPMAGSGGDCICLIAEEAPVLLKGPMAWALNPFMR
jgi:putative transcriptional regulator